VTSRLSTCPHGYGLGQHCPSGFCGDGAGTGIVVEQDLMRAVMASRESARGPVITGGPFQMLLCRACKLIHQDGLPACPACCGPLERVEVSMQFDDVEVISREAEAD
jgi:hypothetical protein